MFSIDFRVDFKEPNGLDKEGLMQHNVAFQLMKLSQFWTSLYNIQIVREISPDKSSKIVKYVFPDEQTYDNFLAHANDNGVDVVSLFYNYQAEVQALGGTLTSNIFDVLGGKLAPT